MGNNAYLCTSNQPDVYPTRTEPGYDPSQQTVACDVDAIPLLWLMLFRASDQRDQPVTTEEGRVTLRAPVAPTEVALARLTPSMAALALAFPEMPSLKEQAELLRQAVESTQRQFVSLELLEVEYMEGPAVFWPIFRHCLLGFENPSMTIEKPQTSLLSKFFKGTLTWQDSLKRITKVSLDSEIPTARLLGAKYERPVPWE